MYDNTGMNKAAIKQVTNHYYRSLKKYFKQIIPGLDVEKIHQFRIAYKKLRAFLRMLSQDQDNANPIKIAKNLKKSYHIAGAIRDLQLQRMRIADATKRKLKKTPAYLILLQQEIKTLAQQLDSISLEKPVTGCKKKTDPLLPKHFPVKRFKNFVNGKWAAIYPIISSRRISDVNIHFIRKSLKDLFYNGKIYKETKQEPGALLLWKEKEIDQLLDELGIFQDKCAAIALLKSYGFSSLNESNQQLLEGMQIEWIKDKLALKKLLIKKLKTTVFPTQPFRT